MCGIAGVVSTIGDGHELRAKQVSKMMESLAHRGPDGSGMWQDSTGKVCLGHRRLAIIDLSSDGAQPMVASNDRWTITCNGEIYNFLELREELESVGAQFRGNSDTEVLLAAVSHWGVDSAIRKTVGMFAFAIWDKKDQILHLARDRSGKKPLYVYAVDNRFYFASEIKAFKSIGTIPLSISQESVYHYLSLGYIPAPLTIYEQVSEASPGYRLQIDSQLRVASFPYWRYPAKDGIELSLQEAVEEADAKLNEAVKLRLRSDVPVGSFLSGGIDSGLITAIAAQHSSTRIKTFTATFENSSFDEAPHARLVAQRYDTEHHELLLNSDLDGLLPRIAAAYDEPFADSSAIPTFAIAEAASSHVKVVLNGEGSDELFAGYRRCMAIKYFSRFSKVFRLIPRSGWNALGNILPVPTNIRTPYSFFHRFVRGIDTNPYVRYLIWSSDAFSETEKRALLKTSNQQMPATETFLADSFSHLDNLNPLPHFMALDFLLGMADCLLVKMDIATMAHGLEARSPFLDHRLIEWAAGLHQKTLLPGRQNKPILRQLAKRYLPDEVVHAPKRGFEIPLVQWMRDDLYDMTFDACTKERGIVMDIFDRASIRTLLEKKTRIDDERWAKQLYALLMLALWEENCA